MRAKITIILIIATVVYAVLGGVAFHYLEQGYEVSLLPQVLQEFGQYANGHSCLNWSDIIELNGILQDMADGGLYIDSGGVLQNGTKWDIRTSIFAAISILTSVGYHRLSPDFAGARVFCIFFGWLGIPLFFTGAIVFGKVAAKAMAKAGQRLCGKTVSARGIFVLTNVIYHLLGFAVFVLVPAAVIGSLEQWNYGEALYFCLLTLHTIGFGDYMAGFNRDVMPSENFMLWYRLAMAFWVLILVTWNISQIVRIIQEIDQSSERSESIIDVKISEEMEVVKNHLPGIPVVDWKKGASVVIKGGRESYLPPSNGNLYPAIGRNSEPPVNPSSMVNVVSVGST